MPLTVIIEHEVGVLTTWPWSSSTKSCSTYRANTSVCSELSVG